MPAFSDSYPQEIIVQKYYLLYKDKLHISFEMTIGQQNFFSSNKRSLITRFHKPDFHIRLNVVIEVILLLTNKRTD